MKRTRLIFWMSVAPGGLALLAFCWTNSHIDHKNDPVATVAIQLGAVQAIPEFLPRVQLSLGDQFEYVGHAHSSLSSPHRTVEQEFTVKVLATVVNGVGDSDRGWQVAYATSDLPEGNASGRDQYSFIQVSINRFGKNISGGHPLAYSSSGAFALPPFPGSSPIPKKGKWQMARHLALGFHPVAVATTHEVGDVEEYEGNGYYRIKVRSSKLLPFEFTDDAWHEGGDPPRLTLEQFSGELWVDEKTGWLVKAAYEVGGTGPENVAVYRDQQGRLCDVNGRPVQGDARTRLKTEFVLRLHESSRLNERELANRRREIAALQEIESQFRLNGIHAAEAISVRQLRDAFFNEFPDSPYLEFVQHIFCQSKIEK